MVMNGEPIRISSDIGGTFTDVALEVGNTLFSAKVLTNYDAPEQAIVDGILSVVSQADISLEDINFFVHGTTLATNALIERSGAKTAFLTTKGFRDTLEMRTENRFEQYDLNITLPRPLIERESRYVAEGRISASGRELRPLCEINVSEFAEQIVLDEYESVAIGFIHSYANPSHEKRAREIVREIVPDISISISSEVSPQMRELERFNTVCSNAYVKPLMSSYLSRLVIIMKKIGISCPLFLIHSGGGLISADTAMEYPVRLLESGPAGGAIFAADVAASHGLKNVLSYDMGGTTAKICLIENYSPQTARTFEVARTYRFKKGSGMQISIPVIEMVEIGAGGGSIARIDNLRQIRVGPQSAGSEPGPACYDRGGDKPTVTDADLLLSRLHPEYFAGGKITLSPELSKSATQKYLADPLGTDPINAAVGLCEIVDENMANAARVHAVESGKELINFTMIAFGGAAPIHACRLCEKLNISTLLVPPGAGVGSAIGFLRAPFAYEAVRTSYLALDSFHYEKINTLLEELILEASSIVRSVSPSGDFRCEIKAYMRYRGQGWEIPVMLDKDRFTKQDVHFFCEAFEVEYKRRFGRILEDVVIEVMSWSVLLTSQKISINKVDIPVQTQIAQYQNSRKVFDAKAKEFLETKIIMRKNLNIGDIVLGPAAIVEDETTTILTQIFKATLQCDGCLKIERRI